MKSCFVFLCFVFFSIAAVLLHSESLCINSVSHHQSPQAAQVLSIDSSVPHTVSVSWCSHSPPDLQGHMRVFCICLSFDGRELPTVGITRFYARLTAAASQQTSCGLFSVPESTLPCGGMSAFHRNISKGQHYLLWLTEKKNGGGDILTLQNSRWSLSCSACKSPRDGSIGLLVLSFSTSTQTMRAQQQVGCFPVDAMWCSDTGILHLNWVFKE